jgi:hypothetical protein
LNTTIEPDAASDSSSQWPWISIRGPNSATKSIGLSADTAGGKAEGMIAALAGASSAVAGADIAAAGGTGGVEIGGVEIGDAVTGIGSVAGAGRIGAATIGACMLGGSAGRVALRRVGRGVRTGCAAGALYISAAMGSTAGRTGKAASARFAGSARVITSARATGTAASTRAIRGLRAWGGSTGIGVAVSLSCPSSFRSDLRTFRRGEVRGGS